MQGQVLKGGASWRSQWAAERETDEWSKCVFIDAAATNSHRYNKWAQRGIARGLGHSKRAGNQGKRKDRLESGSGDKGGAFKAFVRRIRNGELGARGGKESADDYQSGRECGGSVVRVRPLSITEIELSTCWRGAG